MSTTAPAPAAHPDASDVCWYQDQARHPTIGRCPAVCNGVPTQAERQADGKQRPYCEAHAHWRAQDGGRSRLYAIDRVAAP